MVKWEFGCAQVRKWQVRKADPCEFWSVGDTVKATQDLDYSSGNANGVATSLIKAGTFGVLETVSGDVIDVDWAPHSLGMAKVRRSQIIKCQPEEVLRRDDIVRATCDMMFVQDEPPLEIREGDLGTFIKFKSPKIQGSAEGCEAAAQQATLDLD